MALVSAVKRRAREESDELRRAWLWHARGGRTRYERHWRDIVGAYQWYFIVGCNNSGTTLLHDLLASTGSFATFDLEGQRYTRALAAGGTRGYERVWSERLGLLRLGSEDSRQPAARLVHDWMDALGRTASRNVLEKSTINAVRMPWLQEVFEQSYFIGLIRNGYAVAQSIRRTGRKDLRRAARHWNTVNEVMLSDARHIRRFHQVRYEDMVAAPKRVVAEILEFSDLISAAERKNISLPIKIRDANPPAMANLGAGGIEAVNGEAVDLIKRLGYQVLS